LDVRSREAEVFMATTADGLERIETKERAVELAASWRASGLTMAEFCRVHDIAAWSFYQWRRRVDSLPVKAAPRLLEVKLRDAVRRSAVYEVVVGELRVRVGDDFDAETLERLLAVLEHRC
jgi:hypothetical protein